VVYGINLGTIDFNGNMQIEKVFHFINSKDKKLMVVNLYNII